MLAAIKHGLGNLFNFQGRDARQAFWYYVLFVYLITMAIGMAVSIPMSTQAVMTGVQQGMANAGNPDRAAADAAAQAAIASSMHDYMPIMVGVGFVSAAILLVGLAAAIVRRLHDADLSGYWALLPLGLQAINLALIPAQLGKLETMVTAQFNDPLAAFKMYDGVTGLGAVAGWTAIIIVIVLGTRKSTEGPNRFGDAPFTA
jgi:uncharacterized membrane protein YhaH (DUF805 family)